MRMPFGKHRNEKLADVPTGYLLWVTMTVNGHEPLKEAIRTELETRDDTPQEVPPYKGEELTEYIRMEREYRDIVG